jgi:hypothetical protein
MMTRQRTTDNVMLSLFCFVFLGLLDTCLGENDLKEGI